MILLVSDMQKQFIIHLNKQYGSFPAESIWSSFQTYPANVDITWVISLPDADRILLHIKQLILEYQENCLYDSVAIFDSSHTVLGKYCGNISSPIDHDIHGNKAIIQLLSDQTNNIGRILIDYQGIHTASCSNQFVNVISNGIVSSLNYPGAYPGDLNCQWTISTDSVDERILLKYRDVDIGENESLKMTLEDGLVLEVTKETVLVNPLYLYGKISIQFQSSDFDGKRRGFMADFEVGG